MGCSSSSEFGMPPENEDKTIRKVEETKYSQKDSRSRYSVPLNAKASYEPSIVFEIPQLDEHIIKKYPPKRFLRLEDQPINLTTEYIEKRQKLADERRKQILQNRANSAKLTSMKLARRNEQEF